MVVILPPRHKAIEPAFFWQVFLCPFLCVESGKSTVFLENYLVQPCKIKQR